MPDLLSLVAPVAAVVVAEAVEESNDKHCHLPFCHLQFGCCGLCSTEVTSSLLSHCVSRSGFVLDAHSTVIDLQPNSGCIRASCFTGHTCKVSNCLSSAEQFRLGTQHAHASLRRIFRPSVHSWVACLPNDACFLDARAEQFRFGTHNVVSYIEVGKFEIDICYGSARGRCARYATLVESSVLNHCARPFGLGFRRVRRFVNNARLDSRAAQHLFGIVVFPADVAWSQWLGPVPAATSLRK